jgi:peptide/nickel transport system substrate-binding protein
LHLKEPFAAAMAFLESSVPIYPAAYTKAQGSEGTSRAPVGTGPYRVTEVARGKQIVMERYKDYFGGVRGQAKIGKIVMRFVPEYNTQVAELLAGNADFIWRVPKDLAEKMKARKGLKRHGRRHDALRLPAVRHHRASGRRGGASEEARSAPGDRARGEPAGDREEPAGRRHDPRPHLLSEPDRLRVQGRGEIRLRPGQGEAAARESRISERPRLRFYGYRDRQFAEAIMGDLSKVGIRTKLQWLQYAPLRDKVRKGEVPLNS